MDGCPTTLMDVQFASQRYDCDVSFWGISGHKSESAELCWIAKLSRRTQGLSVLGGDAPEHKRAYYSDHDPVFTCFTGYKAYGGCHFSLEQDKL